MQCPQCKKPMQVFSVREMELDRCRECGRVWLDLNEVDRIFGGVHAALSEAEVDQPCPRGHGTMVSGTIGEQPAVVCSYCRGAWVIDTVSKEEKPPPPPKPVPVTAFAKPPKPRANAVQKHELKVGCDVCQKPIPLSEAANTNRGTVCRSCELSDPPRAPHERDWEHPAAGEVVLGVLKALLTNDG